MNRIKFFFLISCLSLLLFSCSNNKIATNDEIKVKEEIEEIQEEVKEQIKVGSSSISSLLILSEIKNKFDDIDIEIEYNDDLNTIIEALEKNEIDMAYLPANKASILYNESNKAFVLGQINSIGNLYAISSSEIQSISDLKNKSIITYDYNGDLKYIIDKSIGMYGKILGVDFNYTDELNNISNQLNDDSIAILPEPLVTEMINENPNLKVILNLNDIFKERFDNQDLISEVLLVRKSYLNSNSEKLKKFLNYSKNSDKLIFNDIKELSDILSNDYGFDKSNVLNSYRNLGLVSIQGKEMKEKYSLYIETLKDLDDSLIGSELPNDDFYYISK